jgi:hypothetical protein
VWRLTALPLLAHFKESEVGSSFAWLRMAISTIVTPLLLPRVVRLCGFA